jgi:hypothetical protein
MCDHHQNGEEAEDEGEHEEGVHHPWNGNLESIHHLMEKRKRMRVAHLTPDEIAMHPRGHALLEAP